MGQAKRRGTFEQRKQEAITKRIKPQVSETPVSIRSLTRRKHNQQLAMAMALSTALLPFRK